MKFTGFPNLLDAPAQIAGDVASSMFGTPYGQYIRGVLGSNNREYGTEIFKENEVDLLKDLAVEQIKNGSFQIDYKNLDADITKKLSYKMELGLTKEQFNKVPSLESYEKNIPEDKPDAWEGVAKWLSSSIDEIL